LENIEIMVKFAAGNLEAINMQNQLNTLQDLIAKNGFLVETNSPGTELIVHENSSTRTLIFKGSNLPTEIVDGKPDSMNGTINSIELIDTNTGDRIASLSGLKLSVANFLKRIDASQHGLGLIKSIFSKSDTIEGGQLDDLLNGYNGNDKVTGGEGKDTLIGGNGADTLIGGNHNDLLQGGAGKDRLIGVGEDNGQNSIDILTGDAGADTFVLGNATTAFYNDGIDDYAIIKDFNSKVDKIELHGDASLYVLGSSPIGEVAGKALYLAAPNGAENELIAIIQGKNSSLDLSASYFSYV
jgi:hypothetical protein